MATTWGDFKTDVRTDLKDTGTTQKWTDAVLFLYAKDAIRDYSTWFPKRVEGATLTLVTDSQYSLPADHIETLRVEHPAGRFLEVRPDVPGRRYRDVTRPVYYYEEGASLYLVGTSLSGEDVILSYWAMHSEPASESDDAFSFTVPDRDLELVRLFIKAKAQGQIRGRQANLDRFKQTGRRTDNPLSPEFDSLMDEYYTKLFERIPGRSITLFRPGRAR